VSGQDLVEQRLSFRLRELAPEPGGEFRDRVMESVDATPQRRAPWLTGGAWPRLAPRFPLSRTVLIVVALGLLAALLATAALTGSRPALPAFHLGKLAYTLNDDIYVADSDGRNAIRVTDANTGGFAYFGPQWWGRRLVFEGQMADFDTSGFTLFVMDADGAGFRKIGNTVGTGRGGSPDGRLFAFISGSGESLEILGTNGPATVLKPPSGYVLWDESDLASFSWSPDSTELLVGACTASPCFKDSREHDLFVVPADGSAPRQLSSHDAPAYHASFSPDGSQIAFQTLEPSNRWYWEYSTIDVMRSDGTGRRVVFPGDYNLWFGWSPGGRQIAVTSGESRSRMWIVDVEGSAPPRQLVPAASSMNFLSWSPDGLSILAVGSGTTGKGGVWTVNLDGSTATVAAGAVDGVWEWIPNDQ